MIYKPCGASHRVFLSTLALGVYLAASSGFAGAQESKQDPGNPIVLRDGLANARFQFEHMKKATVAFLGGSITERDGYRLLVGDLLKKRFPGNQFTFINAGIASTCSNSGAFRLENDILSKGPIDLLFVEFAVNDDQDGHFTREQCIRGMEGIVRHARLENPNMDIVMTFFVNDGMIKTIQAGKVPLSIEAHQAVAELYAIPTVDVAAELTQQIGDGRMTWQTYGGVHPAVPGNELCARMMNDLFTNAWAKPAPPSAGLKSHTLPPKPLDAASYAAGHFIDPKNALIKSGWTYEVPDWSKLPKAAVRAQFKDVPMLCASEPGAVATVDFEGTAIGAYGVSGPDSGIVDVSVDGGSFYPVNLNFGPCAALYYPWTAMLATNLKPGKHTLTLRMSDKTQKTGHAMRIVQFAVNGYAKNPR